MNHESANNRSRQKTISTMTRLQVVRLTELGLTPRKDTIVSSCTKHANRIYNPHRPLLNGCWEKSSEDWNWYKGPNSKMQDKGYIPPFPLRFVQGEIYIHLLLIKGVASMLIRGYIKGRNLCVSLDLQMTYHSAISWVYQVLVLFTTLIKINQ